MSRCHRHQPRWSLTAYALPGGCEWPHVKDRVEKLEVMAPELSELGDDWYELIAYDAEEGKIGRKEILAHRASSPPDDK